MKYAFSDAEAERQAQRAAEEAARAAERGKCFKLFLLQQGLQLYRRNPLRSARVFVAEKYFHGEKDLPTLVRWGEKWWCWAGDRWVQKEDEVLQSEITEFLDPTTKDDSGVQRNFVPNPRDVGAVMKMMVTVVCAAASELTMPGWRGKVLPFGLADVEDLLDVVALGNGLFHLPSGQFIEHTPEFFNLSVCGFNYDPEAKCPMYLKYENDVFKGDEETIEMYRRSFGLCMTFITKFQKIIGLFGYPGSGKGTTGRLWQAALGPGGYKGMSVKTLGGEFGMQHLMGAKVVALSDMKFKGGSSFAMTALERILQVSGEDPQSANRKNRDFWEGMFRFKVLMLGNEPPPFNDDTGALWRRMMILNFGHTIPEEKCDPDLTRKLIAELPGIFNLIVPALLRLLKDGRLVTPKSAAQRAADFVAQTQDMRQFGEAELEFGVAKSVIAEDVLDRYREWRSRNGGTRDDGMTTQALIGKLLNSFPGKIARDDKRVVVRGHKLTQLLGCDLRVANTAAFCQRENRRAELRREALREAELSPAKPAKLRLVFPSSEGPFKRRI
jgi:putative DNA primase/helicase